MRPTSAADRRTAGGGRALARGLVLLLVATSASTRGLARDADAPAPIKPIYHKERSFKIPFRIPPEEAQRLKELRLCVSSDLGETWEALSKTTPDLPSMFFRAARDGEYWFALQTVDVEGRVYPARTDAVVPQMKVIIDTIRPELTVESNGRRGEVASVRWEIRDARLDRSSFVLEFQPQGARDWRQVPVPKPADLIGEATWNAGTADSIRVRASVADRAGNVTERSIDLGDGTPQNPALANKPLAEAAEPSPFGGFTRNSGPAGGSGLPDFPAQPPPGNAPPRLRPSPGPTPVDPGPAPGYNPFDAPSRAPDGNPPAPAESGQRPQLIRSPRFSLSYQVDDAGPAGPARVELWVTQDDGRTWSLRGTDPDRTSPFPVDLGGEGTFGLTIVAKSASDLGDSAPGPGDRPQYLVEVDSKPPTVRLEGAQPLTGVNAGKLAITWRATDLHLGPAPVKILVRQEGEAEWHKIGPPVENSGRFDWTMPQNVPEKFFVRVEVVDTAGNLGSDETPDNAPVLVDRHRPKGRIIGLEPSALNASGAPSRPYR